LEFDGTFSDEVNERVIDLFSKLTPFEYDEEYLILHLEKEMDTSKDVQSFSIQEIVAIYPLSEQSKVSIESKIDQRIKLNTPVFEKILPNIEASIEKKEIEQAIDALWRICNIEGDLSTFVSNIGIDNILKGLEHRKNGIKADKIKDGNYWEYLIAYDRYEYFPNTILGYFYDAGQIFAFSKGQVTFEGSKLHDYLEKLNKTEKQPKIQKIVDSLETEELSKGYVSQTISNDIKQYFVAPIYLMFKEEIRKSDDLDQSYLIKYLEELKKFDDNFKYAVILLGAFFGFRKFYDAYYNSLNLRFYKTYKPNSDEQENVIIKPNTANDTTTESDKMVAKKIIETGKESKDEVDDSIIDKYKRIISEAIQEKSELKLTEIADLIKEKTGEKGRKISNSVVKNIIKQMDGIESFKKGKTEMVRKLSNSELGLNFDNDDK
jgi:hypothetical protein